METRTYPPTPTPNAAAANPPLTKGDDGNVVYRIEARPQDGGARWEWKIETDDISSGITQTYSSASDSLRAALLVAANVASKHGASPSVEEAVAATLEVDHGHTHRVEVWPVSDGMYRWRVVRHELPGIDSSESVVATGTEDDRKGALSQAEYARLAAEDHDRYRAAS